MNIDRTIRIIAGSLILISLALIRATGNLDWLWLTAFVGAGLLLSGITNCCFMACLLKKFGAGSSCGCSGTETKSCGCSTEPKK